MIGGKMIALSCRCMLEQGKNQFHIYYTFVNYTNMINSEIIKYKIIIKAAWKEIESGGLNFRFYAEVITVI